MLEEGREGVLSLRVLYRCQMCLWNLVLPLLLWKGISGQTHLVAVFSQLLFCFPHRWAQQTVLSHLPQPITVTSYGAACLLLDSLML